jgi:hypothetical protein
MFVSPKGVATLDEISKKWAGDRLRQARDEWPRLRKISLSNGRFSLPATAAPHFEDGIDNVFRWR